MTDPKDQPSRAQAAKDHLIGVGVGIHDAIAGKVDDRKTDHIVNVFEMFERELAPHLAPFITEIAQNPAVPQPIRDLLAGLAEPTHLGQSLLIGIAVGAVISPVLGAATAPFIQVLANETWPTLPVVPLTPDLLAASVIKGVHTEAEAATIARKSGIDSSAFHSMVMTAGQSIGMAEALLLLRRGQIGRPEFDKIVHYSNVRNDFIPDILKLMFAPPPSGEVIAGALKGHLSEADAAHKLGEAGIDPANFAWLRATAGRPPGIEQMLHLRNRGKASTQDVTDAVRQSDINDHYLPFVLELGVYVPPVRSVMAMLRAGALSDSEASALFRQNGVRDADIAVYIKEAHHTKASTGKELTGSQVVRMYSDRFVDRPTATARLAKVGYPPDEITILLDFADHLRTEKLQGALIRKIGTLYVAHKIDKTAATTALNGDAVPAAQQADLFHVWDLERAAIVHHPTPAQVVGAYRREEITAHECKTRLLALGVQAVDLGIIVADGWPPTKHVDAKAAAARVIAA